MHPPLILAMLILACASPRTGAAPDAGGSGGQDAAAGTGGGGTTGPGADASAAGSGGSSGGSGEDAPALEAPRDLSGAVARLMLSFEGADPHRHLVRAGTGSGRSFECDRSCVVDMPSGSTATLEVVPSRFGRFTAWSGDCGGSGPCSLRFDVDRRVTARFTNYDRWQRQVGTHAAVAVSGGTVFVAGTFSGTARFGDQERTAVGGTDLFLASFAATGELNWLKVFGTGQFEEAKGIVASATGDVAIWGEVPPVGIDFGGQIARGPHYVATFATDGALRRVWDRNQVTRVAFGPNGGLAIAGTPPVQSVTPAGDLGWQIPPGTFNGGGPIAINDAGELFLAMHLNEATIVGNRPVQSAGSYDVLLIKYSLAAQVLWATTLGGAGEDVPRAMVLDQRGDVLLTGQTVNPLGPSPPPAAPNRREDVFVAKFSGADGALSWVRTLGGVELDTPLAIAADRDSNAIVGAVFGGPATIPLSGPTLLRCRANDGACEPYGSAVHPGSLGRHDSGDLFAAGMGRLARLQLP